ALGEWCAREEHRVRGLEDEWEGRRVLEAQALGNRMDVRRRNGDQLGVRAVAVLADHVDPAASSLDPGVDHDSLARLEARHLVAERLDDSGTLGAEHPRLRHGRQSFANPYVQMVQRRSAQTDAHLARPWLRVRGLLEHEYLGAAVLVDPNRAHRGRLSV